MNHINDAIVKPKHIQKALLLGNRDGVQRLARFVCVDSTDPWRVFEGCQQQRLQALSMPRVSVVDKRVK